MILHWCITRAAHSWQILPCVMTLFPRAGKWVLGGKVDARSVKTPFVKCKPMPLRWNSPLTTQGGGQSSFEVTPWPHIWKVNKYDLDKTFATKILLEMCPYDTDAPQIHAWHRIDLWPPPPNVTLTLGASRCQGAQVHMLTSIHSYCDGFCTSTFWVKHNTNLRLFTNSQTNEHNYMWMYNISLRVNYFSIIALWAI